jgi:hypothetical protein
MDIAHIATVKSQTKNRELVQWLTDVSLALNKSCKGSY